MKNYCLKSYFNFIFLPLYTVSRILGHFHGYDLRSVKVIYGQKNKKHSKNLYHKFKNIIAIIPIRDQESAKNFIALKDCGFDNILVHSDGKLHRKLSLLAFDLHGDAWDPFGYGQEYLAYHLSVKYNIPLIFFGENGEVEYGGEDKHKNMVKAPMEDWEEIFYKGSSAQKLVDAGLKRNIFTREEIASSSFDFYKPPRKEDLERVGCAGHWMSYYERWTPQWN